MSTSTNVAILEPYYGGSHAAFVDTFRSFSRHSTTLTSLPARKWKWRMRGSAMWFARRWSEWAQGGDAKVILTCDMLSVADLRATLPSAFRSLPIVCYFHENQLTYPLPPSENRDYQYGMTNITSCLASDAVIFNSRFHRDDFLAGAAWLLGRMPDFVSPNIVEDMAAKATVLYPPVDVALVQRKPRHGKRRLTILWSHRWEFDKNPEPFFDALLRLDQKGVEFDLVLVGEQFRKAPPVFADAWERLKPHIVHAGYLPDREAYLSTLARCDVVVSTAIQENFGIAMVEAILAGCQPLLPARLAYPEIIPEPNHDQCLYAADADLAGRLGDLLAGRGLCSDQAFADLQHSVFTRFNAKESTAKLDDLLSQVASSALT